MFLLVPARVVLDKGPLNGCACMLCHIEGYKQLYGFYVNNRQFFICTSSAIMQMLITFRTCVCHSRVTLFCMFFVIEDCRAMSFQGCM